MFGRLVDIDIQIKNTLKTYHDSNNKSNIKCDFSITKSFTSTSGQANVSLWGLIPDDIAFLSTNYIKGGGVLNPSFISISAGFKDNKSVIFNGNIVNVKPNLNTSDYNVELQCINAIAPNSQENSKSIKNATLRAVCQNLANTLKLILKYDNTINKNLGDYSYIGNPLTELISLRNYFPDEVDIFISDNFLMVQKKEVLNKGLGRLINSKTGLLGSPVPTATGCKFNTILNPAYKCGDVVRLESKKIPQLNAFYRIIELKHSGSNRSDQWQSEILGQKVN